MSLNKKTLIITGVIFICLALFLFVTLLIVQTSFTAEQEKIEVRNDIELVMRLMQREIEMLDAHTMDWAYWDDTYDFIKDGNTEYVERNLVDSIFEVMQLDYIIYINLLGESVFARGYDRDSGEETAIHPNLIPYIFPEGPYKSQADNSNGISGIIALPGNPLLIAARPILKSNGIGPARGSLIFARQLDDTFIEQLSALTALPLFFEPLSRENRRHLSHAGQLSTGKLFYTKTISQEIKAGFTFIQDIHGETTLMLTVHTPREIHKFARTAEKLTGVLIILAGIFFAGSMFILLKNNVITRLEQLNCDVKEVSSGRTISGRIGALPGNDELTDLSAEINNMLETLEQSQQHIHESEKRYRAVVEEQTDLICRYRPDGTLTFINNAYCKYFGKKKEELLGKTFLNTIPEADLEKCKNFVASLTADNPGGTIEHRVILPSGEIRWQQWTDRVFFDEQGWITEYQAVGRDITERRQAEQKLANYTQELEQLYHKLEKEMDKARQVHERTLLKALPVVEGISFAAHYQPAQKLGGDFYDIIQQENKLILYLSDVSGHGLDGAMLSVFVKHTIKNYISFTPNENITPANTLQHLSRQFSGESYPEELYICIFMAVLDLESMELTYCGAGFQDTPMVQLGNGNKLKLTTKGLFITSYLPAEMLDLHEEGIFLTPGTTIFFNTDGLTEQDTQGTFYMDRLPNIFYANAHLPPLLVARATCEDFRRVNNGFLQGSDDITFLVLQVDPVVGKETHHLQLASDFNELKKLHTVVTDLTNFEKADIFVAGLYEMTANAIEHGNRLNPTKTVTVELTVAKEYIQATVNDEGEGFNWRERLEKTLELEGNQERGRGIAMTRLCCDLLHYNDKGNQVTFIVTTGEDSRPACI